jgi:hypothetical protein
LLAMFALRLKPNTLSEFTRTFDKEVIPLLQKQTGFQDEITFAMPRGLDVVAFSLWDTMEHAEAYNTAGNCRSPTFADRCREASHCEALG